MSIAEMMYSNVSKIDVLAELERLIKAEVTMCEKEETLLLIGQSSFLNKDWLKNCSARLEDIYDPRILATVTNRGMINSQNAVAYVRGTEANLIELLNSWGRTVRTFANSVMSFNQQHAEDGDTARYSADLISLVKLSSDTMKQSISCELPTGQTINGEILKLTIKQSGADGTVPCLSSIGEINRIQNAIRALENLYYDLYKHVAGGLGWDPERTDPNHELKYAIKMDEIFLPIRKLIIDIQIALSLWIVKSVDK